MMLKTATFQQVNALNCLLQEELTVFTDIVNDEDLEGKEFPLPSDHWINRPLSDADEKTFLHLAIDKGLIDFVKVLLQAGANVIAANPTLGKTPLHIAVENGNLDILKLLFRWPKNQPDVNDGIKKSNRTALHLAAEYGNADIMRFLLDRPDIEVNLKDKKGNQTPLYIAAKKGHEICVKMLLESGANPDLKCFGRSIREIIGENLPAINLDSIQRRPRKIAPIVKQTSNALMVKLADIIKEAALNGNNNKYLEEFEGIILGAESAALNKFKHGDVTLLQLAADADLADIVKVLMDNGMNVNGITAKAKQSPLFIACRRGHFDVVKMLCRDNDLDVTCVNESTGETVLHALLKEGMNKKKQSYEKIIHHLLEYDALKAVCNKRDKTDNTALHYATQMWSQDIVRKLLELGANIGMKNHWNEIPISKISPETMEGFLDDFCLTSKGDVNHPDFELTFNYSFLAPPKEDLPFENRNGNFNENKVRNDPESRALDAKNHDEETKMPLPETQALWQIGQSKEHRHLLKHPVVTSFLYLKWGRIRRDFNRNLRFYTLFVFILTWFIFENFGGSPNEKTTIDLIYGLFIAFAIVMGFFVLRDWIMEVKDIMKEEKIRSEDDSYSSGKQVLVCLLVNWIDVIFLAILGLVIFGGRSDNLLWGILLVLTGLLVLREFFQVTVSLKRYVLSPENWIEVTVIILIGVLLFHNQEPYQDLNRHLSAIAIVLSWAELITLVGKHPKLTRYNVYVTMFYKVLGTFCFFLCWYAFFIIAFGLAFYIMLHDAKNVEYPFFNKPWWALVKTSTMFVGELEFADIPINLESPYCPLAYLFFLAFVFLIVVVLMNLLNGLAVSDTGIIQEKAEIVAYISRVDTISYTESVLLGDPFDFLSNWPALKSLSNIPSLSCCVQLYNHKLIQRLFHKLTGATKLLLFYNFLPDKKLTFKPNSKRRDCSCLHVEMMDEDIISAAKSIELKKMRKEQESDLDKKVEMLQSEISDLGNKLDFIITKLNLK